jgi:hypothetical protein
LVLIAGLNRESFSKFFTSILIQIPFLSLRFLAFTDHSSVFENYINDQTKISNAPISPEIAQKLPYLMARTIVIWLSMEKKWKNFENFFQKFSSKN